MPLPEAASSFLDSAVMAMKEENESTINFYAEISGKEVENEAHRMIEQTKKRIMSCGVKSCEASSWRIVREVGPRRYHIAIDLKTVK
jgi:tRNA G37 N-methylase Trm5